MDSIRPRIPNWSKAKSTGYAGLAIMLFVCFTAICITGCSSAPSTTSSKSIDTSRIAVSDKPVYRLVASRVRDENVESRYRYDSGLLTAELEYNSLSEYTYKDGGLTREQKTDGNNGVAGTYIENATCDKQGRITSVERSFKGTVWKYSYSYYGDTLNLKTYTKDSSGTTTIEFDEQGYITTIQKSSGKTASFSYQQLSDDELGIVYTDFDGAQTKAIAIIDENGNIATITDGATYVDYLYEEVSTPSAWLFTETDISQQMIGYTSRWLFETI